MSAKAANQMQEVSFNLRMTSKQLQRQSKKCEKNEKANRKKVAEAIKKGNMEGAKIYAANAIREKNQALNYLRLGSRMDAVVSRIDAAIRMNMLTRGMQGVVSGMDKTLQSMDMNKISKLMEKFESQFEDLDVKSGYMDDTLESSTSLSTPQNEVNSLMKEVAEVNGLEVADQMGELSVPSKDKSAAASSSGPSEEPVAAGDVPSDHSGTGGGSSNGGGSAASSLAERLERLKK
eukprot:gb/GECG01000150.1/.p1 GENE.gb/GECG01000150.1/~~gb/GECG01000150.1/.p1  ORF type:complete len:234 (+),score=50.83 gb/GECG01000150.1/:1-702(+)